MTPPRPKELEVEGKLCLVAAGGEGEWRQCPPIKLYTNAFIWDPTSGKILLGYKKRGFGIHMYNGFGGKVEAGETPLLAAKRELQEEAGITADLEICGILLFTNDKQDFTSQIYYFRAENYEGTPTESDEMRPEWFALPEHFCNTGRASEVLKPIPLDQMWRDDEYWMPSLLSKKFFVGRADFKEVPGKSGRDLYELERWWFGEKE